VVHSVISAKKEAEEGRSWSEAGRAKSVRPYLKNRVQRARGVAQVEEPLSRNHKALSLNPSTPPHSDLVEPLKGS
jgi:hypothetical protein